MALFNKNPNEAAYVGGKKHWADVIKNSGPGELLIWRQPEEDFNTKSTLAVLVPLLIQLLLFGLFEMDYKIAYNEDILRYNLTKKRIPLYYFIGISLIVSNTILNSIGTI